MGLLCDISQPRFSNIFSAGVEKTIYSPVPGNKNPYEEVLDDVKVFSRMRSYQTEALRCLAAYGLIDSERLKESRVKRTNSPLPAELQKRIDEVPVRLRNVITLIESPFTELPLYGAKGFKFRTKLIDYKYDV